LCRYASAATTSVGGATAVMETSATGPASAAARSRRRSRGAALTLREEVGSMLCGAGNASRLERERDFL
jgi:hypothetical protein